ncbi:MAG: ribosome silencing factor [Elusimicrobia bacterium]|nr:ribosome silencing factor [Elusimicrobiota bacterium]
MARAFKSVALAAARAAQDKKGEAVTLLHVSRESPITDYMLIVTALSRPHLQALEQAVEEALEALGAPCLHRAKPQSDQWRVLDFGGLLVHVMSQETREYYALEKLYHGSPQVKLKP